MLNREVTCTDKFAELRKQAQAQLEKEIESMEPLAPEKTRELFHELRTQQIELELQNEELRQAQARLQNMQQRYSGLYDFAPIGYLTIGVNGNIIEANLTASILFGVERSNLIRQPFSAFVVPENQDTYYYFRKELLHSQKSSDCELELARRDGSRFHALVKFSINTDIDGTKGRYRIVISDITDRKLAEAKLKEQKLQLELALQASNTGLWDWDLKTDKVFYSPEWKKQIGYADEEISNEFFEWENRVHPDDLERAKSRIMEFIKHPYPNYENEFRFRHKDGSYRWILTQASLIMDEQGKPIRMLGDHIDITERRHAEAALQKAYCDLDERAKELNCLYGISKLVEKEDSLQNLLQGVVDLIPFSWQYPEVTCAQIKLDGQSYKTDNFKKTKWLQTQEVIVFGKNAGSIEVFYLEEKPEIDEGPFIKEERNLINGIAERLGHIIERKEVEKALLTAEKKFKNLLETINLIAIMLDCDGSITFCNDYFLQLTGWTRDEVLNKNWFAMFLPADIRETVHSIFTTSIKERDFPALYENSIITRDGQRKDVRWNNSILHDATGTVIGVASIGTDITEHKKVLAQLCQSQKMEAIGTLAGGIAHDFNNIITIIIGFGELIRDRASDESFVRQNIETVLKAADRSKFLVQQILAFSRQADYELIGIKLQSLVKETIKLLRATLPATVKIVADIHSQCGVLKADPTKINQILMNLCTNAVQAMDEKGLLTVTLQEVHLGAEALKFQQEKTPGPFVQLSVSDTGCGIDQETLKSMYVPFFTTKEKGRGTGMGLSVVHGIVESHGGFIVVDTERGRGTTFNVFFPVTEEEEFLEVETKSQPRHGKERILFVDDEEALTKLSRRTLESLGYVVTAETDSMKALEIFKADPDQFDLVISDQSMPEMSGLELAGEILQIRPGMPIIICTGYSSKISEDDTKVQGISKFLPKPYNKKILSDAIREVLDAKS